MRKDLLSGALALGLLCGAGQMAVAGESVWDHNGSTMLWSSSGQQRWVTYHNPRRGMRNVGVTSGTLLFEGRRTGYRMSGTAYVFKRGCPPAGYHVKGNINPANELYVVLRGAAPVRARGGCRVTGYSWKSGNARLTFRYLYKR